MNLIRRIVALSCSAIIFTFGTAYADFYVGFGYGQWLPFVQLNATVTVVGFSPPMKYPIGEARMPPVNEYKCFYLPSDALPSGEKVLHVVLKSTLYGNTKVLYNGPLSTGDALIVYGGPFLPLIAVQKWGWCNYRNSYHML